MLAKIDRFQAKIFKDDPNGPKCCFCFPLKCGIFFLGIFAFLDFGKLLGDMFQFFEYHAITGVIMLPAVVCSLGNCVAFLRYFFKDNAENRSRLILGCFLQIVAEFIALVAYIVVIIVLGSGFSFMRALNNYLIPALLWGYYRYVCQQWAQLGLNSQQPRSQERQPASQRQQSYLQENPNA